MRLAFKTSHFFHEEFNEIQTPLQLTLTRIVPSFVLFLLLSEQKHLDLNLTESPTLKALELMVSKMQSDINILIIALFLLS